ncbi:hypothetical protein SB781_32785, partial [Paraburkholderia sp. SIMBA_061]
MSANTTTTDSSASAQEAQSDHRLAEEIERLGSRLKAARQSVGQVIFGQQEVVDQTLITLLCGGHALLIGVP